VDPQPRNGICPTATLISLALTLALAPTEAAAEAPGEEAHRCGYRSPEGCVADLEAAIAAGEIAPPGSRTIPRIRAVPESVAEERPVTPADIFPYPDASEILLGNFSNGQLFSLMVEAANVLLSLHGDRYQFVGFWTNFRTHHELGAAFYLPVENDVLGIGSPTADGWPVFNLRPALGLGGDTVEGLLMMWNVNASRWRVGTGSDAAFTRLALAHELEHRFGVYLPALLDGRVLQGDDAGCGRSGHWSWRVDGQGSAMEISDWVGSNPAVLERRFVTFNTDIPGGLFSYPDLYLMGYVSPDELDRGVEELRHVESTRCVLGETHPGGGSSFASADIIAAAGPRVPDHNKAPHHFRVGWIMLHRLGDPPGADELEKAAAILTQQQVDWRAGTLGRGIMDHSLGERVDPDPGEGRSPLALEVFSTGLSGVPGHSQVVRYRVGNRSRVRLTVHDGAGREILALVDEMQSPGTYLVSWNGVHDTRSPVPTGHYFLRLERGYSVDSSPMLIID
jgi:hypothetical protein